MPELVLVVGGTGRTGRHVVARLLLDGRRVRVLSRDPARAAALLGDEAEVVAGDLTAAADLLPVVTGAGVVVLVHGSDDGRGTPETVDHGGTVRVVDAAAAAGGRARIVYVSTLYATRPDNPLNDYGHGLQWKFRAEQHVRASGLPYVVVRPGWLTDPDPDRCGVRLEQGDTGEGQVAREQVADVLVAAGRTPAALGRTFELFDAPGPAPRDWQRLFEGLSPDAVTAVAAGSRPPATPAPRAGQE